MDPKIILLPLILVIVVMGFVFIPQNTLSNTNLRNVSGIIVRTDSYCSGAAPPPELVAELAKEKPFPNKKLYVRQGNVNIPSKPMIREFESDNAGNFQISLSSGVYCIIDEIKKDELNLSEFTSSRSLFKVRSEQCLRDLWQTCDKILEVGNSDIKDFSIRFDNKCPWDIYSSCGTYMGPLPA